MTIAESSQPGRSSSGRPDPYIGPCPPWCQDAGDGHRLEIGPDDRKHASGWTTIELPLMEMNVARTPEGLVVDPVTVDVQLERRDREVEPTVAITINEENDLLLTMANAIAVRDVLTKLLGEWEAADRLA